jgi:hypothetical protein
MRAAPLAARLTLSASISSGTGSPILETHESVLHGFWKQQIAALHLIAHCEELVRHPTPE